MEESLEMGLVCYVWCSAALHGVLGTSRWMIVSMTGREGFEEAGGRRVSVRRGEEKVLAHVLVCIEVCHVVDE